MTANMLTHPVELTEDEIDLVTGGGGLVNLVLTGDNISILNGFNLLNNINVPITIRNVANNNNLAVGAIIQLLGGGAAIRQHQAT